MNNSFPGFGTIETFLKQIVAAINGLNTTVSNAFPAPLVGNVVYDPPSIADGASVSTTVSVVGATLGNTAVASFSLSLLGLALSAYVSADDVVTVVFSNSTGAPVDLASGTILVRVYTH